MKACFILATRPEIIKCSPLIKLFIKKKINFFLIHTGQHYSFNLDKIFFKELKLPLPKYNLHIRSKHPIYEAHHTGRMMIKLENIILKEVPDIVLVHGDTNTALAGALTTAKISTKRLIINKEIKLGHIESGLRSFDKMMPEETNRIIVDHLSDVLFVPTKAAMKNLKNENINNKKKSLVLCGNTVVDSLYQNLNIAKNKNILDKLCLKKRKYFLVTLHRPETVDNFKRLSDLLKTLQLLATSYKIPVIYPMHPRTKKNIVNNNIKIPNNIKIIDPLSYFNFLNLESNAKIILTDSGGVQEEACVLKVPCITVRNNTERPETVKIGANLISGYKKNKILKCVKKMFNNKKKWKNPFGNGNSSNIILKYLRSKF